MSDAPPAEDKKEEKKEKKVVDIWTQVLQARRKEEEEEKSKAPPEATIIFCGPRQSGKSSLIQSYMFKDKDLSGEIKPTTALDYKYTRSSVGMSMEKDLTHFWELGGGRAMSPLLDYALTPASVSFSFVVLSVDLSRPSRIAGNIKFWLDTLRARVVSCTKNASTQALKAMSAVQTDRLEAGHPDRSLVDPLPVPCLIVGTKYDQFKNNEPEAMKIVCRALRAVAHHNGCSLLFVSQKHKSLLQTFRSRIHRHIYNRAGSKTVQTNHTKPLSVPAGQDTFDDIELPDSATAGMGHVMAWSEKLAEVFPPNDQEDEELDVQLDSNSLALQPEPLVDNTLAMREEDLKRVKAEVALKRKMKQADNEFKLAAESDASAIK